MTEGNADQDNKPLGMRRRLGLVVHDISFVPLTIYHDFNHVHFADNVTPSVITGDSRHVGMDQMSEPQTSNLSLRPAGSIKVSSRLSKV